MTCNVIASGSSGNATVLNRDLLIDCGVPYSWLYKFRLDIKVILLTHQHFDHFRPSTLRAFNNYRPSVRFACCDWLVPLLLEADIPMMQIDVMEPGEWYSYSGIANVSPFRTIHNVPNCGWKVHTAQGEKIFYATDLATLDGIEAKSYDLYLIEMNHKREEIEARIAAKTAAGEFSYEVEAAKNHLSEEQALDWLAENAGPYSKFIPMHQHQDKGGGEDG